MSDDRGPVLQTTVPGAVRRFWWLFLLIVLLFAAAGAAYPLVRAPSAVATASLVVEDPRSAGLFRNGAPSATYVRDQAVILQLPVTVDLVADDLRKQGLPRMSTEEFLKSLTVETDGESNLLRISFTHPDPAVPVAAVNGLVERYRDVLSFQSQRAAREQLDVLERTLSRLDQEIARLPAGDPVAADAIRTRTELVQQRAVLQLGDAGGDNGIRVVSPATRSKIENELPVAATALLGAALGAVPAAAAAYLLAQRRRRFTHRYQPEIVLGRPLLSEVPDFSAERLASDLPSYENAESSSAESFRFLSSALGIQQRSTRLRTVAVVSAASREGKTTVAANLAICAAQDGRRVLAVDADLTGQGLGFLLVGEDRSGPGLIQVLDGSARLEAVVRRATYRTTGLDVLTGGSDDRFVTELFASSAAGELLASLAERYDLVVIDLPPVLQVAYTASLLAKVDAALLVVPHGASIASVEELAERVAFIDTPVAGYVYNKAPLRREIGRHSRLVSDNKRRPTQPEAEPTPVTRLDAVAWAAEERPEPDRTQAPGA